MHKRACTFTLWLLKKNSEAQLSHTFQPLYVRAYTYRIKALWYERPYTPGYTEHIKCTLAVVSIHANTDHARNNRHRVCNTRFTKWRLVCKSETTELNGLGAFTTHYTLATKGEAHLQQELVLCNSLHWLDEERSNVFTHTYFPLNFLQSGRDR